MRRLWSPAENPPRREFVDAVDDLAELEPCFSVRLAASLAMVWIGGTGIGYVLNEPGGITGRAVVLAPGIAPARVLMAHALCDLDGLAASPEWRALFRRCRPLLGDAPRADCAQEWWARSFALQAAGRIEAVLGDREVAETVAAYHRRVVDSYP
ncbi:hypothetical protein OIE66_10430 [Nonomuraea sp. NBC_01738]|uniref:hypothetical protein n=1 Tax=Nonomuraea sp. NBC_01738 TaxID=2976003 RepID=UPI002E118D6C|nr:hypothetical protein OIE66_10430 [Nonomuraea sp. NBC_01738]